MTVKKADGSRITHGGLGGVDLTFCGASPWFELLATSSGNYPYLGIWGRDLNESRISTPGFIQFAVLSFP